MAYFKQSFVDRLVSNPWVSLAAIIIVLLAMTLGVGYIKYQNVEEVRVTVSGKERVTTGYGQDQSSKYLVYTDKTTYQVADSIWMGRWNSSDVYGKIKNNTCYDMTVRGYRVPFLSMYQNIDTIVECY